MDSTPDRPDLADVNLVAVIGCGVLGAGWALHFLRQGYTVAVWDPNSEALERLTTFVDNKWQLAERIGLVAGASRQNLIVCTSLADALEGAQFVQESGSERLEVKRPLYKEFDDLTAPGVVIASSTSGLPMTEIAAGCLTNDRMVVGHPFHPVYLVPMVEVGGGEDTSEEALDWACRFYHRSDMRPTRVDGDLPGFVGNRLQEAMFREVLHMLMRGEATIEQIEAATVYGPGLRWAWMGPVLSYHLAGGAGGLAATLEHFHVAGNDWVHAGPPPDITDEQVAQLTTLIGDLFHGRDVEALETERDEFLLKMALWRASGDLTGSL